MFQDLRYGMRMLMKMPGFTFVAILSLAIGIGANTSIFSIVKSVLIEPLPFAKPDLLLQARYHDESTGTEDDWVSHRDLVDWQERSQSFERIAAYRFAMLNLAEDNHPEAIYGMSATYQLLPALDVQPAMGRYFSQEEDQPGHDRVIILSDDLWRRRFAANVDIIGQTIGSSGENYTVVGRLLNGHDSSDAPSIAVINETAAERFWPGEDPIGKRLSFEQTDGREVWRQVVGIVRGTHLKRLEESTTAEVYVPIEQTLGRTTDILVARSAMRQASLAAALRQAVTEVDKDQPIFLTISLEDLLADSVAKQRFSLFLLGVFSALALLLAALGVYGVVSYAVAQRTREIGIRIALGAQGADVLRMVVARGMQPVVVGAITGLLAAIAFSGVLSSLLYGVTATDPITFAAVSLLLLIVALMACCVPARRATKVDPMKALRHE